MGRACWGPWLPLVSRQPWCGDATPPWEAQGSPLLAPSPSLTPLLDHSAACVVTLHCERDRWLAGWSQRCLSPRA